MTTPDKKPSAEIAAEEYVDKLYRQGGVIPNGDGKWNLYKDIFLAGIEWSRNVEWWLRIQKTPKEAAGSVTSSDKNRKAEEWCNKNGIALQDRGTVREQWLPHPVAEKAYNAYLAGCAHRDKQWISVRDKQPDRAGDYWVYRVPRQYSEGVLEGQWAYSRAPMTTRHWNGERWQSGQEITHWMPLPPPPPSKESEE